jgi:hypothetical protein
MEAMGQWAVVLSEDEFADERLYTRDGITIETGDTIETVDVRAPAIGDSAALMVATEPPALFGLGTVVASPNEGAVLVEYVRRVPDEPSPLPADLAAIGQPGLHALTPAQYTRLAGMVSDAGADGSSRTEWFVTVALPIEAATRAEAVREFWTYVDKLGPRELPAFVWPRGDELAMQVFVLGAVANLDPEEE